MSNERECATCGRVQGQGHTQSCPYKAEDVVTFHPVAATPFVIAHERNVGAAPIDVEPYRAALATLLQAIDDAAANVGHWPIANGDPGADYFEEARSDARRLLDAALTRERSAGAAPTRDAIYGALLTIDAKLAGPFTIEDSARFADAIAARLSEGSDR